jgi:hypothetical protein
VRVPGERALASMTDQIRNGVRVGNAAIDRLAPWMKKAGVDLPKPVSQEEA